MNYKLIYTFFLFSTLSFVSCTDETAEEKPAEQEQTASTVPPARSIPYTLLKQYPHNAHSYTQGLQFVDGYMYECTGHYGQSHIYKYELETGKVLNEYKLDDKYFGEGLTVMGDKIYIITWREKTGLIFDRATFKPLGTFQLETDEGWGLTNDSTHLIYSDGSPYLYYLNPADLKQVKRIEVVDAYGPVGNINELEYINGYIYANQWETEFILKIDPATGHVVGKADLRNLRGQAGIPARSYSEDMPEVLNGIAYDNETNRIFITGKNWPKILEIKLDN
ncbi:MAG: glutaminyl-peptide cyclotransferase [Taibaiella sp.]|nr:glutaminyl-peptide cyclotransferase [Taibaiella sp.]